MKSHQPLTIGGQAIIEGVLMRSAHYMVIAVRDPKHKKVHLKTEKINSLTNKVSFFGLPFIRGTISLIETIVLGIKALNYSANKAIEKEEEKLSDTTLLFMVIFSLIMGILIFAFLPYVITNALGLREQTHPVLFNLMDGFIKVIILLVYVILIARMQDVHRLFQYHGAEHKAVHCFEAKKKLTVKNAQQFSTIHPRCGTAFLLIVVSVGIIIFSFIPLLVKWGFPQVNTWPWLLRYLFLFSLRILFLPIIAGVSYEILRLGGRYPKNVGVKIILFPGLLFQNLTTREPTDKQVEVALMSLQAVVNRETRSNGK